jgi:hypothetical protein
MDEKNSGPRRLLGQPLLGKNLKALLIFEAALTMLHGCPPAVACPGLNPQAHHKL